MFLTRKGSARFVVVAVALAAMAVFLGGCFAFNSPPAAHFVVLGGQYPVTGEVILDATLSYDLDGDQLTYECRIWNVTNPCCEFLAGHAVCSCGVFYWVPFAEYGCCAAPQARASTGDSIAVQAVQAAPERVDVEGLVPTPTGRRGIYRIACTADDGKDSRTAVKVVEVTEGVSIRVIAEWDDNG